MPGAVKVLVPIAIAATAIFAPEALAAIGSEAASAVGVGTVSSATATAIGAGLVSGGATLAEGGSISDALKSAVAGGIGAGIGGAVSGATGIGSLGAAAAGASNSLLQGGNAQDILRSAVLSGGTALAVQGINEAYQAAQPEGPGLRAPSGDILGQGGAVDQGGLNANSISSGQGFKMSSNALFPSDTAPIMLRAGDNGGVQPAYRSAASYLTPNLETGQFASPDTAARDTSITERPGLSSSTQKALSRLIGYGLNQAFPGQSATQGVGRASQLPTISPSGAVSGTTQGLGGFRGTGILGAEGSTSPRSEAWNESSLRLRDALGV